MTLSSGSNIALIVLLAITLHSSQHFTLAEVLVTRAAKLALKIGLHTAGQRQTPPSDVPQIEKIRLRTWWELYTLDKYFAILHRRPDYGLRGCEVQILTHS